MKSNHIALVIGTLDTGGAERQMLVLAKGLAQRGRRVTLVTIFPGGAYADQVAEESGITHYALTPSRGTHVIRRLVQLAAAPCRLRRLITRQQPDRIYSMLHLSNLFAWLATRGRYRSRLVWGYRASNMQLNWKRRIPDRLCAMVSKTVPLLIGNSHTGLQYAQAHGYNAKRALVIPNGIDVETFQPQPQQGARFRQEIGVDPDAPLIGIVARLDPMKGHDLFLEAAAQLTRSVPRCRFICVGDGPKDYKRRLGERTRELGLEQHVIWTGDLADMPAVYSALTVLVSSSYGEGFSNVIAEAMACGVPCVVTDVGDSAAIVGFTGVVVPVLKTECLRSGIRSIIESELDSEQGVTISLPRKRIVQQFSVKNAVQQTIEALEGRK